MKTAGQKVQAVVVIPYRRCKFCEESFAVLREASSGDPFLSHTSPPCKVFLESGVANFLHYYTCLECRPEGFGPKGNRGAYRCPIAPKAGQ